jgi:tetratricopeptide (TPR) repeat protein
MVNFFRTQFTLVLTCLTFLPDLSIKAKQQLPDSLSQQIKNVKGLRDQFSALHQATNFYIEINSLDKIGETAKQELTIAQLLKNDSLLGISFTDLGIFFDGKSDFSNALRFYLKALKLAEIVQNPGEIARINNDISTTYSEIKNYSETLNYLLKSESFALQPEVRQRHSSLPIVIHINMTEAYIALGKPDSALKYIQLAKRENLDVKSVGFETYMLGDFGLVYEKLKKNDLAEIFYQKSIQQADSLKAIRFIADNTYHYANFLLEQKRYTEANEIARKSLIASQKEGYKNGIINASGILRNTYFKLNKPNSAYYYANMQVDYRDSVFNQQNMNQMQDMTFAEQIRQTEESHRIFEEKEKVKRNIEFAAIAIGILTFIILFLIFSHTSVASEKAINVLCIIGLLITFEFFNLLLEPILENIANDSQWLKFLSMVIIAAILVPCHHRLEKWISEKLIEKHKKLRIFQAEQSKIINDKQSRR